MALAVPLPLVQFPENPRTLILHRCKTSRDLNQIHAHLVKTRLLLNPSILENILESAALVIPDAMDYAISIFDKIEEPNASAFNVMIRGITRNQSSEDALVLFLKMCESSVPPDEFTFSCILKACSRSRALSEGEQIHAQILKLGFAWKEFVGNSLIHMYGSCGRVKSARIVFDEMPKRGVMSWNCLFAGHSKSGHWDEIVNLFRQMQEWHVQFDEVTLISVLTACGRLVDLELGEWIRGYIEANGLKGNLTLITCLVDMYAKCGKLIEARNLFDQTERKDVVTWSAMISGYAQARQCREAIELFHQMQAAKVSPNEVTMVSVLSSCAVLGALETGKWLHLFIIRKRGLKLTVTLGTALVDFYAKCGLIESAIDVFTEMSRKNVFSWTALIQGLASNGQGKRALEFFNLMQKENVRPNNVTFLGVLSACSHAGLVDEGRNLFLKMEEFEIEPRMEHYGCMVDILGRAGLVEEAYRFTLAMPLQPNAVIWRTLLASCRYYYHD